MVPERTDCRQRPLSRSRLQWIVFSLLLAVLPATAQTAAEGTSYALLIGIGSYDQWPSLINPIPDISALASELRQRYGFLPEVLENPTRGELLGQLRRYAALTYGPRDQLLIAFAGHGSYDEVSRMGYLVAHDSASRSRDPNFETLLDYPKLLTLIDSIPCRQILLVVDACFAGALTANHGTPPEGSSANVDIHERWRYQSRVFFTSGSMEYTPDGDPDRHTPFMRQLLAGLENPDPSGTLAIEELLKGPMSTLKPVPSWGTFGIDEGRGGFVFTARGTEATAVAGNLDSPTPASSAPQPPPPPTPQLRKQPAAVIEEELKRLYRRRNLFDYAWSPEADFPNQFRMQSQGIWDVVMDLATGLMWQQAGSENRLSREQADTYIAELNSSRHAGFSDWRLPTLEELASLLEPGRQSTGLFLYPYFDPEQETCWSADRDRISKLPYFVSFNTGRTVPAYSLGRYFVRAVRSN